MKFIVLSFFRNSAGAQIERFMKQCKALQNKLPEVYELNLVAVYGDCTDNTKQELIDLAKEFHITLHLVEHNHGGPVFGSTEALERMKALSGVGNAGLDKAHELTRGNGKVFYVESDLIWDADVVVRLSKALDMHVEADAIAPLVFAGQHFYDVFAFRGKDGERFAPFPPYHSSMNGKAVEVSSVGSCFIMEAWMLHDTRIADGGALPGFWKAARAHNYRVFVDPAEKVWHPA